MTSVFADTFYYFALLNPTDAAHARAVEPPGHARTAPCPGVPAHPGSGVFEDSARGQGVPAQLDERQSRACADPAVLMLQCREEEGNDLGLNTTQGSGESIMERIKRDARGGLPDLHRVAAFQGCKERRCRHPHVGDRRHRECRLKAHLAVAVVPERFQQRRDGLLPGSHVSGKIFQR